MSPPIDSDRTDSDSTDDESADDRGFGDRVADFLDSIGLEELTDDYRDEHRAAEGRLADAFDPLPAALAEPPAIGEVNKVNTHDDGGDVLVPVVTVLFEESGEPDPDAVWDVAGTVLAAVHPTFADLHVRYYDLQFAYADEAEETVVYRRITVHPPLVERFLDGDLDRDALRAAVAEGDDGDDGVPPVNWKRFDAESMAASGTYAGSTAAIAAACAASSAGAAAACAGSAAGAAGGAAGGAGGC